MRLRRPRLFRLCLPDDDGQMLSLSEAVAMSLRKTRLVPAVRAVFLRFLYRKMKRDLYHRGLLDVFGRWRRLY